MKYYKILVISLLFFVFIQQNGVAQKISKIDSARALHKPSKALMLSAILPGAGQVYNKKYWKVPIIYGLLGFLAYETVYNNNKYQFYKEAMANASSLGPYNYYYTGQLSQIPFNQRLYVTQINKDNFRRTRDLDVIIFVLSYVANFVDAGVDAYFMTYDVGTELALDVKPKINVAYDPFSLNASNLNSSTLGISLTLRLK